MKNETRKIFIWLIPKNLKSGSIFMEIVYYSAYPDIQTLLWKTLKYFTKWLQISTIFHLHTKRTSMAERKKEKKTFMFFIRFTLYWNGAVVIVTNRFKVILWNIYAYLKCKEWNGTNWRKENWKLCIFDAIDMKQLTEPWLENWFSKIEKERHFSIHIEWHIK